MSLMSKGNFPPSGFRVSPIPRTSVGMSTSYHLILTLDREKLNFRVTKMGRRVTKELLKTGRMSYSQRYSKEIKDME